MATITQALTTTFTPAPSCLASTFNLDNRDYLTTAYGNTAVVRGVDPACYPNRFYAVDSIVSSTSVAPFYSPGVCPTGWSTAVAATSNDASITTVTCCPTLMNPVNPNDMPNAPALFPMCIGGFYTASTGGPGRTAIQVITDSATTTVSIYNSFQLPIVFHYQASDVSLFSSVAHTTPAMTSAPTMSSAMTATAASAAPTASATTSASINSSFSTTVSSSSAIQSSSVASSTSSGLGLSPTTSIGIGVGVGLGASVIIALAAMLFCVSRKKAQAQSTLPTQAPNQAAPPYEQHGQHFAGMSPDAWREAPPLPAKNGVAGRPGQLTYATDRSLTVHEMLSAPLSELQSEREAVVHEVDGRSRYGP